jgi:hypothetical protein
VFQNKRSEVENGYICMSIDPRRAHAACMHGHGATTAMVCPCVLVGSFSFSTSIGGPGRRNSTLFSSYYGTAVPSPTHAKSWISMGRPHVDMSVLLRAYR